MTAEGNKCAVCNEPALKRCQRCRSSWYCRREHQVSDWQTHKDSCKIIAADIARADSHVIHKREFDRIRKQYGLDKPDKAGSIAEMLANNNNTAEAAAGNVEEVEEEGGGGVSAPEFAKMFGMTTTEAVVFLEWIKVGVKFKEEVLDGAKGLAL